MTVVSLPAPFLLFLGDARRLTDVKTAAGVAQWRRPDCVGEWALPEGTASVGLPAMSPQAAAAAGARALLVGVAPLGGRLPAAWIPALQSAAAAGLHLVSGLHDRLTAYPALRDAAASHRVELIDLRVPPKDLPVGSGSRRSGRRLLTIGSDCAVGKKYTALAFTRALQAAGADASFCATGQTGIMIAERGVPLDAVPADFLSGAIEALSPAAAPDHWDVIEGQGSLHHPAYAGVSLGLLHGAQADGLVLCHEAGRTHLEDLPGYPLPPLRDLAEQALSHARLTNQQARLVALSLNTSALSPDAAQALKAEMSEALSVPAVDPLRDDLAPIARTLLALPQRAPA